jgi:hypothetical protein
VFRLCHAAHLADPTETRQTCFYDPGLGWERGRTKRGSWRWVYDTLSQATGLGISQNIKDCYEALICSYAPGDRIFLFGFSRGAYTVRSLGGVLKLCGIPQKGRSGLSPKTDKTTRKALVEEAVETIYKHDGTKEQREDLGLKFRKAYGGELSPPYFVGVWDTVRALGFPGTGDIFVWRHEFHDATLDKKVFRARHALAIDEARDLYAPNLWDEAEETDPERIKQIWFAGAHSDVGGAYEKHGLGDVTLDWMVREATALPHPLLLDEATLDLKANPLGRQHDELVTSPRPFWRGLRRLSERDHVADAVLTRFSAPSAPLLDDMVPYRPEGLRHHPQFAAFYANLPAPVDITKLPWWRRLILTFKEKWARKKR